MSSVVSTGAAIGQAVPSASVTMEKIPEAMQRNGTGRIVEELDHARAQEYALLATLLSRSPDAPMITGLTLLRGDASPLGTAHAALGEAAGAPVKRPSGANISKLFPGFG